MIKWCEYEDINKADCINCFNGLPTNECKHYEEIEGKKLRQMVHERAERDRKKVYNKAIDDYMNKLCNHCMQQTNECYKLECPFCTDGCDVVNIAEKMKAGESDENN